MERTVNLGFNDIQGLDDYGKVLIFSPARGAYTKKGVFVDAQFVPNTFLGYGQSQTRSVIQNDALNLGFLQFSGEGLADCEIAIGEFAQCHFVHSG